MEINSQRQSNNDLKLKLTQTRDELLQATEHVQEHLASASSENEPTANNNCQRDSYAETPIFLEHAPFSWNRNQVLSLCGFVSFITKYNFVTI